VAEHFWLRMLLVFVAGVLNRFTQASGRIAGRLRLPAWSPEKEARQLACSSRPLSRSATLRGVNGPVSSSTKFGDSQSGFGRWPSCAKLVFVSLR